MSAVASPSTKGVQGGGTVATFRAIIDARKAEGGRLTLDDAIAVIVPVCMDLKERHDRGESYYVHPSAITRGPDGLMRLNPQLATNPKDARDRAALAPELLRASGASGGGARSSVFAVGAMLYEAVCGTPVGPGMRRPRDVDPKLPEALEHLLAKALVADPSHRPDDLGALASAMHHLAPMKSIPPPDADLSRLDKSEDFEVDIRLSIMPPARPDGAPPPPPSIPRVSAPEPKRPAVAVPPTNGAAAAAAAAAAAIKDPTRQLAGLKARLESDPRPRYVVNKQRMDHGPFSAVELLQQIASHKFVGTDILRDELTGGSKAIDEWDEFAPFAQHARMHRDIAQEKKEVAIVEKAEKKAGAAKFIIGIIAAVALLAVGVFFVIKSVGSRKDGGDLSDDPSAVDLSGGGSLKGGKKAVGGGGKGGGAGGGAAGFVGGMSYEQALASNKEEITMGGKGGPDLSDAQLSAPMKNASFITGCGAPDSMKVTVRVAIKNGRAYGVSVYTNPPNPQVQSCVDRHVRGLGWPANAKMDSFTTTY
jgi:eukaryotic-like serine/threonine-protein kinase